ncbi:small GTP-binding protein sar1, putative, partial [Plasmodium ovale curtisi]
LKHLLETEDLSTVPFVVLGNKIDKPDAASEDELRQHLNLFSNSTISNIKGRTGVRPVELFMCSVIRRMGYAAAFKWISQFLT